MTSFGADINYCMLNIKLTQIPVSFSPCYLCAMHSVSCYLKHLYHSSQSPLRLAKHFISESFTLSYQELIIHLLKHCQKWGSF